MNKELVIKVLENNLDLNQFAILQLIATDTYLDQLWDTKARGYRETLIRKGLVSELNNQFFVTQRGMDLYANCKGMEKEIDEPTTIAHNPIDDLAKEVLEACKEKIKKAGHTRGFKINGYPYLVSESVLADRLTTFCKKWKVTNLPKVKRAILDYTDQVLSGATKWPRLLKYFIFKDDDKKGMISELLDYMEGMPDEEVVKQWVDPRSLF